MYAKSFGKKRKSALVFTLLTALPLVGCGSVQPVLTKIEYVQQQVPAALLTCENEPPVPKDTNDGEAMANHRIDLALAGDDCRNKLRAVGRVVAPK